MTDSDAAAARRQSVGRWASRVGLVGLPVLWLVLASTLPRASFRDLTIDVVCTSGNPAVQVWIESRSGGSEFAKPNSLTQATVARFVFVQTFTGPYQVRVGCGGTPQQWGLTVVSTYGDQTYRRLVCHDLGYHDASTTGCVDQSA